MTTVTKRVVPADIWDALKASAEQHGGIGGGRAWTSDGRAPWCIAGHCLDATPRYGDTRSRWQQVLGVDAFLQLNHQNDEAVEAINVRKGTDPRARVTWDEYVAEMGWERGE